MHASSIAPWHARFKARRSVRASPAMGVPRVPRHASLTIASKASWSDGTVQPVRSASPPRRRRRGRCGARDDVTHVSSTPRHRALTSVAPCLLCVCLLCTPHERCFVHHMRRVFLLLSCSTCVPCALARGHTCATSSCRHTRLLRPRAFFVRLLRASTCACRPRACLLGMVARETLGSPARLVSLHSDCTCAGSCRRPTCSAR